MSTITNEEVIQTMLDNDGVSPGDPQMDSIWEYINIGTGKRMWAIFMSKHHNDLASSPFVGSYVMLWSKTQGHVNKIGILKLLEDE